MKKLQFLLILTIILSILTGCGGLNTWHSRRSEHSLVILHTNDHHGHPLAFYDYPAPGQGGLPARATLVNQIRDEYPHVMVLDAGDLNTGRPESNFFKAEPDILGYNYIRYDALAIGNHEFDLNMADMQQQIRRSTFPWLCANATKDGQYLENINPYIIKAYNGFTVAVFGLVSARTAFTGNPEHIRGIVFEDEVSVALKLVPELNKKADIVIALVHMGIYADAATGSKRLAAKVPGIDLIVDGHSHTRLESPVMIQNEITGKKVPVVQAKYWGLYVGKALLRIKNGDVASLDWSLIPINVKSKEKTDGKEIFRFIGRELEEDPVLLAILKPYEEKVEVLLSEVIGSATGPFINDHTREKETAIGDIIADSQKWYMKKMGLDIDFAFQNGGGIRATLGSGEIRRKNVYEILPFDNTICVVTLKGSDVISLFNKAPKNVGQGAMPQVSDGVTFTINTATGTVENLLIRGQPVDPSGTYIIALNSYLAAGGDGYSEFKNHVDVYDSSMMQRDAFIEYILHLGGTITPKTYERIRIH